MLICKIFSGTDSFKVEEEMNNFFSKTPQITIHSICQSSDNQRVFISVFFNVKTKAARMKEAIATEQIETIVAKADLPSN